MANETNDNNQHNQQPKTSKVDDWFDSKIAEYKSPAHTFDLGKILSEGPDMTKEQAQ